MPIMPPRGVVLRHVAVAYVDGSVSLFVRCLCSGFGNLMYVCLVMVRLSVETWLKKCYPFNAGTFLSLFMAQIYGDYDEH